MFTSILTISDGTITMQSAMLCIGAALVLGLLAAFVYMVSSERYTKSFVVTMALLPVLVMAVILMTNGSLGTAIAVAGAFSLVRFRSAPGTSKEILGIFFVMAIGLACGMGQVLFAAVLTCVVSFVFLLLMKSPFAERNRESRVLKVTIPEDLDYTEIFDDVFAQYTTSAHLDKVRTVNLGSMYELDYQIVLKDARREKAMIDDLRVRNGNLSIVCGRHSENENVL